MLSEVPWPLSLRGCRGHVARQSSRTRETDDFVDPRATDGPIGVCGVKKPGTRRSAAQDAAPRLLDRPPLLGPRLRHRGDRRARRLRLRHVSARDGSAPASSTTIPASRRVLEKLGFVAVGGYETPLAARAAARSRRSTCSSRARHGQARASGDEVPRPGEGLHPLRRRRRRRGLVPPREIHRVRRTGRRRRRPRRRRLGGGGRRAEHAHRLPLPAAFQGEDRRPRHGPQPRRRQGAPTSCSASPSARRFSRRTTRR